MRYRGLSTPSLEAAGGETCGICPQEETGPHRHISVNVGALPVFPRASKRLISPKHQIRFMLE